jgi:hypothetical protein
VAAAYTIVVEPGASWRETWRLLDASGSPVDLSGYSAAMSWLAEDGQAVAAFTSLPGGGIVLGGPAGTIVPTATPGQVARVLPGQSYTYALYLTDPSGFVTRALKGPVVADP